MNLERITVAEVERYKGARLAGSLPGRTPSPATINRELACLRKLLNLAVDLTVLVENPLTGKLRMLKEPEGRVRYLKPAEADRLLAECADHIRPVVHLALLTGMRRNELLGLPWSEVDLERGVVRLPGARTKNGRPRLVPLSQEARRVLRGARKEAIESCPLVFHRRGKPLRSIRDGFLEAVKRAGLRDFHFHDTRHSFASALAMRGVSLQAIAEPWPWRSGTPTCLPRSYRER